MGKTLLGYTLRNVYGLSNAVEVNQKSLHGSFNGWAARKCLVIGDDITGSDKREIADHMKSLITQDRLRVNEKFLAEYDMPNCVNFLLTSNRASALYLEDDDRRYFVWQVDHKGDPEWYPRYDKWYKTQKATAAMHHMLLNVDLTGFDPFAKAMTTTSKQTMIEDTRSAHSAWIHRLKDDPDFSLRVGKAPLEGALFTGQEILNVYNADPANYGSTVKLQTFCVELKAAGIKQLAQVRWGNPSRQDRFFALRDVVKWSKASPAEVRRYVEKSKAQ